MVSQHAQNKNAICLSCKSTIKRKYKDNSHIDQICKVCNNVFNNRTIRTTCSEQCKNIIHSHFGKKSAQLQAENRRSKNEIHFAELCKTQYKEVLTNVPMFNGWDADVILPNEKIAILWNGKWHHEKITKKHSVLQVQNRDKIKIHEIKMAGYSPYIIDDMGREDNSFVIQEFEKFKIIHPYVL